MKLFFADPTETLHNYLGVAAKKMNHPLRLLISYFYHGNTDIDALIAKLGGPDKVELFADSGAFSAWSQNKPLSVTEYGDWLLKWKGKFHVYANLDVKGNLDAGLKNQQYLESLGLIPLPVFHAGEPDSVLADMINVYPYIALGGTAGEKMSQDTQIRFYIKAFTMAKGETVYHGFGMTSWKLLKMFPWFSTDSSSFAAGVRYGGVSLFDQRAGRWLKGNLGNYKTWLGHEDTVRMYGFDWREFADRSKNHRPRIVEIMGMSYINAEKWLTMWHGQTEVPGRGRVAWHQL